MGLQNKNNECNNIIKGIIFILLSALGFSTMQLFVKIAGDLPSVQKSFFRNLISVIITLIPIIKNSKKLSSIKGSIGLITLRSIFGTLGIVLNFYAVSQISLGDAALLQKISPFVVIILSFIFLHEKIKPYQIISVAIAFVGVIFVIRPSGGVINLGSIAGLLGAVSAGAAYTCLRKLGLRGIKGESIILFFSAFSCVSLLPFVIVNYKPMSINQILCLVLVGVCATIGQYGITYGYIYAPARNVSVFEYSQIIFAALLGYMFLDELPDLYSWAGYAIIIIIGIFMIIKGTKKDE